MRPKILLAGIWHESNSFSPLLTDLTAFRSFQYGEGSEIAEKFSGTETEIGGILAASKSLDFELAPAVYAAAVPAGPVTAETFNHLTKMICAAVRNVKNCKGALVVLHGAMVVEGEKDADGIFLQRLRKELGSERLIVATFDMHANISEAQVQHADVLIGYDTFPHTDCGERGREAARVMAKLLLSPKRPAKAFRKLPLITVSQKQNTSDPPMNDIMAAVAKVEKDPGIICCSVAQGFPHSDVPHLGVSVIAYGEQSPVEKSADKIARMIWSRREKFLTDLVPPDKAVQAAMETATGPIILSEPADNVGGGAPGDGCVILESLLRMGAHSAVIVVYDPEAVQQAKRIGMTGRFDSMVGGKASDLHGPSVRLEGRVERIDNVTYQRTGAYMTGQKVRMGDIAVINSDGVRVVITSHRVPPFDADHLYAAGIDPAQQHIIVAKSGGGWRGGFGDIAAGVYYVDTPGVCTTNLERLPYQHLKRPAYPFDRDVIWP